MLLANKILISSEGILNVPIELDVKFGELAMSTMKLMI